MYRIIGSKGCTRCEMIKNLFDSKGIKYQYDLINETPDRDIILQLASANKITNYPIVFDESNTIITDFSKIGS